MKVQKLQLSEKSGHNLPLFQKVMKTLKNTNIFYEVPDITSLFHFCAQHSITIKHKIFWDVVSCCILPP